jgi:hypothetical protein
MLLYFSVHGRVGGYRSGGVGLKVKVQNERKEKFKTKSPVCFHHNNTKNILLTLWF